MRTDLPAAPSIAIVDAASFVLPYVHGLASGLKDCGWQVTVFASHTRYNEAFLDALLASGMPVRRWSISGSLAPRWRGVLNHLRLWAEVWRRRREFDRINLQFLVLWPVDLLMAWLLRARFVLSLHNAVPHGFAGWRHRPTAWMLRWVRVVYVSDAVRADALARYGPDADGEVLGHGLLPVRPERPQPRSYGPPTPATGLVFWGNVAPYKGVELMLELARDPAWQRLGLALEVQGAFAPELSWLREALGAAGVKVVDRYLSADELDALMRRPVVFLMPYIQATQSGALYTLLHQGCRFLCSDSGDFGALLREQGLQALLLEERTPAAVTRAWQRLRDDPQTAALQRAQQRCEWSRRLERAAQAYGLGY